MALDLLFSIGSTLASTAWDLTTAQYMYTRGPWQGVRAGTGISHPGFGVLGGVGPGNWVAKALRKNNTRLATVAPKSLRHGVAKFFAGGDVDVWGALAFNPRHAGSRYLRGAEVYMSDEQSIANRAYGEKMLGSHYRARFIRGAGTVAGVLAIAGLVADVAMPIAYSAGRATAQITRIGRGAVAQMGMNQLDWGSRAASAFMMSQASTERQRAVQSLNQLGMTGNGIMGREAAMMHR
jgi:hypothetical protein